MLKTIYVKGNVSFARDPMLCYLIQRRIKMNGWWISFKG